MKKEKVSVSVRALDVEKKKKSEKMNFGEGGRKGGKYDGKI